MQVYVKDYKKRLVCSFPDVSSLENCDINQTTVQNFHAECNRISISSEEFKGNKIVSPEQTIHKLYINNSEDVFYIRLVPKLNNFKKMKVLKPLPEDAEFYYIMHQNLKQYLSGNNMFSIVFSFIHTSRGTEIIVL